MAEPDRFTAETRAQWRGWLRAHHKTSSGIWLVTYKKDSGRPYLPYADTVEEALCFGWIDSRPNRLDQSRFMRLFSPRKPKSPWSKLNKQRVEALIERGLMAPAGLAVIEAAKASGAWSSYDGVEALQMPDDLRAALKANPKAAAHFEAFPPSSKKNIFWWIESAKRPETRAKRIAETVAMAADNLKANHYR
ncbi:MAG: YdeI/OmpD-associated family protein [Hyphomicrobiales bacterium]|nr:YdeI/OmpD-associated family protein [Hyphomicrobiales bacterium]